VETRKSRASRIALSAAVTILVLGLVPVALAGKGGSHGGGGTTTDTSSTLSLKMVVDQNGNHAANWNDQVTFEVYTTATNRPYVLLNCYQSGTWVSTASGGFFPESPWPPNFTLASGAWTSGAGDCTATLYMVTSNGRSSTLKTLSFHVDS
jgi:hypothetical protein